MAVDLGFLGTWGKRDPNPAQSASTQGFTPAYATTQGGGAGYDVQYTTITPEMAQKKQREMTPEAYTAWVDSLEKLPGGVTREKVVFAAPGEDPSGYTSFRDQYAQAALGALSGGGRPVPQVTPGLNAMRQGAQVDTRGVDYAQMLGLGARGQQQDALGMQRQAAMGQAPSVAAIQQQQGLDAALSGQFALANSARGGASQRAAAQGVAAQQAGAMQQQAVGQAAALRAAEMAQARDAYAAGATGIRQGDVSQGALSGQMSSTQAQLIQQQQLANQGVISEADLANQRAFMAGQGMDDARLFGMTNAVVGMDTGQLGAQQQTQADYLQLLGLQSGVALDRERRGEEQRNAVVGGALNAAGGFMGMG